MFFRIKIIAIVLTLLCFSTKVVASSKWGKGELKLSNFVVEKFIEYLRGGGGVTRTPYLFAVTVDGFGYNYYYCPNGGGCEGGDEQILNECSRYSNGVDCFLFARKRTIKWKNGINPGKGKVSRISSKLSDEKIKEKLSDLGFFGNSTSSTFSSIDSKDNETKKIEKKIVKKYELKGERAIALSWEGYESLIAGSIVFIEKNNKGNMLLSLPNDDGTCEGNYILQDSGRGTWNLSCSNNLGAAGTLKLEKNGGITGIGRDFNNKKVNFTVSKQL